MRTRRPKIQSELTWGPVAKGPKPAWRATPERPATERGAPMEVVLHAGNLKKAMACFRRSWGRPVSTA